jgi:hypothetical protein
MNSSERFEHWKRYYEKLDRKRAFNRVLDRIWNRIYLPIFYFWCIIVLTWGTILFVHDYRLISNYAHIDAFTSDYYTKWRTDGTPGKDPKKN